jgi:hypothetical protein
MLIVFPLPEPLLDPAVALVALPEPPAALEEVEELEDDDPHATSTLDRSVVPMTAAALLILTRNTAHLLSGCRHRSWRGRAPGSGSASGFFSEPVDR